MKKKLVSIITIMAILITVLSVSISALALTRPLSLDSEVTYSTNGYDDVVMFTFTPEVSGFYSFLSYNTYASEAYLYTKRVVNPSTNEKEIVHLGFSNSSPEWKKHGQSSELQFCLTHYLEKGTTYTYAAGWCFPTAQSRAMTVKLVCDSYSEEVIDSIEVSCPASLDVYSGGNMLTDDNGEQYYFYNDYTKIIANMHVTVHFANGTTKTVIGEKSIDGYEINYSHSQNQNHWYPQNHPSYKGNIITVSILDKSVDYDVIIKNSALYALRGKIVDMAGNPVKDAVIMNGSNTLAVTDTNGNFYSPMIPGEYKLSASALNSIPREFSVLVSVDNEQNDHTSTPINLCTCDYVKDGYINAKDYAYMLHNNINDYEQFKSSINFNKYKYTKIDLK